MNLKSERNDNDLTLNDSKWPNTFWSRLNFIILTLNINTGFYYFKYAETKMKKYRKLVATSDSRLEFTLISKQIISFNLKKWVLSHGRKGFPVHVLLTVQVSGTSKCSKKISDFQLIFEHVFRRK